MPLGPVDGGEKYVSVHDFKSAFMNVFNRSSRLTYSLAPQRRGTRTRTMRPRRTSPTRIRPRTRPARGKKKSLRLPALKLMASLYPKGLGEIVESHTATPGCIESLRIHPLLTFGSTWI